VIINVIECLHPADVALSLTSVIEYIAVRGYGWVEGGGGGGPLYYDDLNTESCDFLKVAITG